MDGKNFDRKVLTAISQALAELLLTGETLTTTAKILGVSKQNAHYHLKKLINAQIILTKSKGVINTYKEGPTYSAFQEAVKKTGRVRPDFLTEKTRYENIRFIGDIEKEFSESRTFWQEEKRGRQYHRNTDLPGLPTFTRLQNGRLGLVFTQKLWAENTPQGLTEAERTINGWVLSAMRFLERKGIFLKNIVQECQEIEETPGETIDKAVSRETVRIKLERRSRGILNDSMKSEAHAEAHKSYSELELKTNDRAYKVKLLLMPERIEKLKEAQDQINAVVTELIKLETTQTEALRMQARAISQLKKNEPELYLN